MVSTADVQASTSPDIVSIIRALGMDAMSELFLNLTDVSDIYGTLMSNTSLRQCTRKCVKKLTSKRLVNMPLINFRDFTELSEIDSNVLFVIDSVDDADVLKTMPKLTMFNLFVNDTQMSIDEFCEKVLTILLQYLEHPTNINNGDDNRIGRTLFNSTIRICGRIRLTPTIDVIPDIISTGYEDNTMIASPYCDVGIVINNGKVMTINCGREHKMIELVQTILNIDPDVNIAIPVVYFREHDLSKYYPGRFEYYMYAHYPVRHAVMNIDDLQMCQINKTLRRFIRDGDFGLIDPKSPPGPQNPDLKSQLSIVNTGLGNVDLIHHLLRTYLYVNCFKPGAVDAWKYSEMMMGEYQFIKMFRADTHIHTYFSRIAGIYNELIDRREDLTDQHKYLLKFDFESFNITSFMHLGRMCCDMVDPNKIPIRQILKVEITTPTIANPFGDPSLIETDRTVFLGQSPLCYPTSELPYIQMENTIDVDGESDTKSVVSTGYHTPILPIQPVDGLIRSNVVTSVGSVGHWSYALTTHAPVYMLDGSIKHV